jgi:hypothetical protein
LRVGAGSDSCRVGNEIGLGIAQRKAGGGHDQSPGRACKSVSTLHLSNLLCINNLNEARSLSRLRAS